MLSYFPARDAEEAVTKEFMRAELAEMELRMGSHLRAEIRRTVWLNVGSLVAFAGLIIAAVKF